MINLAGELDISQKKHLFFSAPLGRQHIHPLIKSKRVSGCGTCSRQPLHLHQRSPHQTRQEQDLPVPASRFTWRQECAKSSAVSRGDGGVGGPPATEPTGPDESLPSRPHAQSKGSAICSLLIPRQATYHLDPADPFEPPPRSLSVLLSSTPSFLSADSSRSSSCFIRDGRKGVLTFHFLCALAYGFIPANQNTYCNLSSAGESLSPSPSASSRSSFPLSPTLVVSL